MKRNRNNLKRSAALTMFLLVFCLLAPGCSTDEAGVDQRVPVRIAYLHNDLHQLAFYVAGEKGFYEEAGIEVEVAGVYKSGVELMAAFQAGALDAGYVGLAPAMVAAANGKAAVKIAAQANAAGSAIVVLKDLNLEALQDLEGLRVAVPNIGTVQDFLLNLALDARGAAATGIEKMIMSPPEMVSAIISGGIDACVVWEPYAALILSGGHGKVLLDSNQIWYGHPCCVLAVDAAFLQERRETAAALVEAHRRATAYILENEEEALDLAVSFTGLSREIVEAAMKNIQFACRLDAEAALTYARYLTEQGLVRLDDPPAFMDSLIDTSLLKEGSD